MSGISNLRKKPPSASIEAEDSAEASPDRKPGSVRDIAVSLYEGRQSISKAGSELRNHISYRVVKGFANILLVLMPKDLEITDERYQSAIPAARMVLYFGLISFGMVFFFDSRINYEIPKTAYGLALSGSMSIIFVGTDIQSAMRDNYNVKPDDRDVKDPVFHAIVKRFGALLLFVAGFLLQIYVLYFSPVYSIPETIPLLVTQISTETILNGVTVAVGFLVAIFIIGPRKLFFHAIRHFIAPSIFIFVIGINMAESYGEAPAQIFFLLSILAVYVYYFIQMVKTVGEGVLFGMRAALSSEDEIKD